MEKSKDMEISRNISASTGASSIKLIALSLRFADRGKGDTEAKGWGSWSSTKRSILAKHVSHSSRSLTTDPLRKG